MNTNSPEYSFLEREIKAIGIAIESVTTAARLDEDTFKNIFLPMFYGIEEEKLHPHAKIGGWIHCAGGVYNEVDIIGKEGEVLFRVPPVKLQLPVNYKRDRRRSSLLSELQTANLHAARHPVQGANYLKSVLDSYIVETKELDQVLSYMRRWSDIFKRYGYPSLPIPDSTSGNENNTTEDRTQVDEIEVLL